MILRRSESGVPEKHHWGWTGNHWATEKDAWDHADRLPYRTEVIRAYVKTTYE